MSDQSASDDRLAEVERPTAELTSQILDAQIMKLPISEEQVQALAKGARLLHDNDLPWPPMLSQVLHKLMQDRTDAEREPEPSSEEDAGPALKGPSRLLGAFRRERGPADPR